MIPVHQGTSERWGQAQSLSRALSTMPTARGAVALGDPPICAALVHALEAPLKFKGSVSLVRVCGLALCER